MYQSIFWTISSHGFPTPDRGPRLGWLGELSATLLLSEVCFSTLLAVYLMPIDVADTLIYCT